MRLAQKPLRWLTYRLTSGIRNGATNCVTRKRRGMSTHRGVTKVLLGSGPLNFGTKKVQIKSVHMSELTLPLSHLHYHYRGKKQTAKWTKPSTE